MYTSNLLRGLALMIMITLLSVVAACASGNRSGGPGGQQGPPPEAIEACEGKQEGDAVSFSGRRGESVSATCQTVNDQLVAVPEGHKRQ